MKKNAKVIYLTDGMVEDLAILKDVSGLTVSALIYKAIERLIEKNQDLLKEYKDGKFQD